MTAYLFKWILTEMKIRKTLLVNGNVLNDYLTAWLNVIFLSLFGYLCLATGVFRHKMALSCRISLPLSAKLTAILGHFCIDGIL
jgi:hypothetical protein